MKKILALVLVAAMVFSCLVLASCDGKKEESSTASENSIVASSDESKADESATSTDESVASADESATSEDATSSDETSEDATSEDATSEDVTSEDATSEDATSEDVSTEVPEEIKATATYKFFQKIDDIDLTQGFKMSAPYENQIIDIFVLGDKASAKAPTEINGVNVEIKIIVKEGKSYAVFEDQKIYVVFEGNVFGDDFFNNAKYLSSKFEEINGQFLAGAEFVSTTTEEIEGVTYTVETFKDVETGDLAKFHITANGEGAFVMEEDEKIIIEYDGTKLTVTTGDEVVSLEIGVPEGIFDIPADYTEQKIS